MEQAAAAETIEVGRQADDLFAASMTDQELPERPTVAEVALWLGKCTATIYAWAQTGKIPCRRVGRTYIFNKSELLEWWSESEEDF